jgi:DNA polymerase I-like protein with 3'-5' exonuclease and polymerase domains
VVEQLREPSFVVRESRNYFGILPFKAETSRNATAGCLFQAPVSLRGLIQALPGTALIYADYCQREYYIAARLANDQEMLRLYAEGDPYVAFGVMAGLMPATATKKSHPLEREIAKTVSLAVLYGQWIFSMAQKLNISVNRAEDLLAAHQQRFPQVWRWSDERVRNGYLQRRTDTAWGWYLAVNSQTKRQTLRNFPVQGTGADIMRLAHILLFEGGIRVCAPVHDAFLIECPEAELNETTAEVCRLMTLAGRYVLGNSSILRADARVLRHPERLTEKRGEAMWTRIVETVTRLSGRLPNLQISKRAYF